MTCVRLAAKYKMDHVIVELVEKWEFKFREKKKEVGDFEICVHSIMKKNKRL